MEEGLNLSPILIPLAALLVGWAIGFFDSNLRTSKKVKQAEDSAKAAIEAAERKAAQAQAPASDGDPGLMRIRNENGRLTLDLDGVRMNTSALTAEQRRRLIDMLTAIRPWLEGKPASPPPAPASPPQSAPASNSERVSPTPVTTPPSSPARPAPATKPAPTAKRKEEELEAVPTSIVGQINRILQARIEGTSLEARGLILMESPTGGVNVFIGMDKYEGVDAVPDEEVKTAIRSATAEWESKYTPGL